MKLFLVTQQAKRYRQFKRNGVNNYLVTFTDIWTGRGFSLKEFRQAITNKTDTEAIFIDSGAHPISRGHAPDFDKYHADYLAFIKACYHDIHCFAELDIEFRVGQDKVDEWFKEIQKIDPDGKCLRAWHPSHSFDRFKEYCASSNYVALGGGWNTRARIPKDDVMRLVHYAYNCGTKIHGFGCTSNYLKEFPFYSGDSNSWMAVEMFGKHIEFKDGNLIVHKSGKASQRDGHPPTSHKALVPPMKRKDHAIQAFLQFESYLTNLWKWRGIQWPD